MRMRLVFNNFKEKREQYYKGRIKLKYNTLSVVF